MVFAVAALAAWPGCYREVTDATAARTAVRYTGTEPWTIDGVRPGQTEAEVKSLLGEPREVRPSMGTRTAFWATANTVVTFDAAGRVVDVMGSAVKAGGKAIVPAGSSEEEVAQILGPGKVQKSYRPKGSGIISLSSVHTGTTITYDNSGVRFELSVFGESAGHYRAFRVQAKK